MKNLLDDLFQKNSIIIPEKYIDKFKEAIKKEINSPVVGELGNVYGLKIISDKKLDNIGFITDNEGKIIKRLKF